MSLPVQFRGGVAAIRTAFLSALEEVQILAWVGEDNKGNPDYAAAVSYFGFVEYMPQDRPGMPGQVTRAAAHIIFPEQIAPNGAADRVEPIDPRDKVILPDGTSVPIVEVGKIRDAETQLPYFVELWVGMRRVTQQ